MTEDEDASVNLYVTPLPEPALHSNGSYVFQQIAA